MHKSHLILVALLCLPVLSATALAKGQIHFRSVSVKLPGDDATYPEGPNLDRIAANCVACHSANMVLTQPHLTKAQWQAEVSKMRNAYKAPIDPGDIDAIVDYLTALPPQP